MGPTVDNALKDLRRPLGAWAMLCLVGSALSVGVLKFWEASYANVDAGAALPDAAMFTALYGLLLSIISGVVAVTRKGRSRLIPALTVIVVFVLVPGYVMIALVEVPLLTAVKLAEHWRLSCFVVASALCLAVPLWLARAQHANVTRTLTSKVRAEVLKPLSILSTASGVVALASLFVLERLAIVRPLRIFRRPTVAEVLPYIPFLVVLLMSLIMAARPLRGAHQNRILPIFFLTTFALILPGPFFVGLYLVLLGLIALLWSR